jgi:transposase
MAAEGLWMSIVERGRSHLIRRTREKQLSQRQASECLGIGVRQFKRLVRSWKQHGDAGLVSRQRGRSSNNRLAAGQRERIAELLRDKYADFGPTLAVEKLLEREAIAVSAETVRQMQIDMGVWRPKRRRAKRVFQLRERRPRFGELIQIDGSPHAWFEDRGPRCTLIVFIDDATSRLTALQFAPSGDDPGVSDGIAEPCSGARLPAGILLGPARHLPGQCEGRGERGRQACPWA